MTAWAHSLIRISNYEVETLQKRLAEVVDRREAGEARLAGLDAEARAEREGATTCADAAMMLRAYLKGWAARRDQAEEGLTLLRAEEDGARDALSQAFESLKKFEHVAERTRLDQLIAADRRETAGFDELGLRRRA